MAAQRRPGDHPGDEAAEQDVEVQMAGEADQSEDEDDRDPHDQLVAGLEVALQRRPPLPHDPHREQGDGDGEEDEGDQDRRLLQRVVGREEQGDEQDRAELSRGAGAEQVGAELRAQLAAVAQDRDQGADRGRRHRRAGVDEGVDYAERREDAADRIGERDREQPAVAAEAQRRPPDPFEVDLIAGEVEEHPEAEVGEELAEFVGCSPAEPMRPDRDAEQQLEHDDRRRDPGRQRRDGHRGDCRAQHDQEERGRVDVDQGGVNRKALPSTRILSR